MLGSIRLLQKSGERRELNTLCGSLDLDRVVSATVAGGVYSCGAWPGAAQVLLALALARHRQGAGWLVVVQSVREQEEMASELEAWGEEPLLVP